MDASTSACTSRSTRSATSSPPVPAAIPPRRAVMVGSHIDTVRTGGRFDGNLGVLAGLEIVETLAQTRHHDSAADPGGVLHRRGGRSVRPRHARQPGVRRRSCGRGGARCARSRRRRPARRRTDAHRLRRPHTRARRARSRTAYAELHIEQGPVLEDEGITIGVVTGRAGDLVDRGDGDRSVCPCRHDTDAVAPRSDGGGGSRIIHEVRLIAGYLGAPQVATVGRLDVVPNLVNVIPSNVVFSVDLRNTDEARLKEAEAEVFAACRAYCRRRGLRDLDANAGPLRAGRVRQRHDRSRRGHGPAPRPFDQADAVGRRPRCADAGPGVPDLDGLRAERQRAVAQHRRVHDARPTSTAGANVLLQVVLERAAEVHASSEGRRPKPTPFSTAARCTVANCTVKRSYCPLVRATNLSLTIRGGSTRR